MKIVLNKSWGGFGLSEKALAMLNLNYWEDIDRFDPDLVRVVEELGEEANGGYAKLRVVDIPDDITDFDIDEYDGNERVIYVLNGKLHWA